MRNFTFSPIVLSLLISIPASTSAETILNNSFKKLNHKLLIDKKKAAESTRTQKTQTSSKNDSLKRIIDAKSKTVKPNTSKKKVSKSAFSTSGVTSDIIINEDFSGFSKGTELSPVSLTGNEYAEIPSNKTIIEGWYGAGIYEAGGSCFIEEDFNWGDGDISTGVIETPMINVPGNATISFRAKSDNIDGDAIYILWIYGDGINDADGYMADLTNEWNEYVIEYDDTYTDIYFQMYSLESGLYIDDIKIENADDASSSISAPSYIYATDITKTSFTANWTNIYNVDYYLLNVYSKTGDSQNSVEETTIIEDFENLNVSQNKFIDATNPNYPKGWDIDLTTNGTSRQVYTSDGNIVDYISLAFDATGDYAITPIFEAPITSFSFYIKSLGSDKGSKLSVLGFDGVSWVKIKDINVSDYTSMTQIQFDAKEITQEYTSLKFSYTKTGNNNCSFDHVSITYGDSDITKDYHLKDEPVFGSSYNVEGLDENKTYYFTVTSVNSKETSAPSYEYKVISENGSDIDIPTLLPATNVTDEGFTANWNSVSGADAYGIYIKLEHNAKNDCNYILYNETFDKVDFGTIEEPVFSEASYDYLDEYTNKCDWGATNAVFANGMIGFYNSVEYDYPGSLTSPCFDLSNIDSNSNINVSFRSTAKEGETVSITIYDDEYNVVDNSDIEIKSENEIIDVNFSNINKVIFIDITTDANIIFIDDIKITSELKKDNSIILAYKYVETEATSHYFYTPDLIKGDKLSYMVMAFDNNNNESDLSQEMNVGNPTHINNHYNNLDVYFDGQLYVNTDKETVVSIYSIDGTLYKSIIATVGKNIISIDKGIYIVRVDDKSIKVVK